MIKEIIIDENICDFSLHLKQRKGYLKLSNTIAYSNLSIDALVLYITLAKLSEKKQVSEFYLREWIKVKEDKKMPIPRLRKAKNELIKYNLLEIKKVRNKNLISYEWLLKDENENLKKHFNKNLDEISAKIDNKNSEKTKKTFYQKYLENDNLNLSENSAKNESKFPKNSTLSGDCFSTTEKSPIYKDTRANLNNNIYNNINIKFNNINLENLENKNLNLENLENNLKEKKENIKEKNAFAFSKTEKNPFLDNSPLNTQKRPLNQKTTFRASLVLADMKKCIYEVNKNDYERQTMRNKFKAPIASELMGQIKAFNDKNGTNYDERLADDFIGYWEARDWKRNGKRMASVNGSLYTWLKNAKNWEAEKRAKNTTKTKSKLSDERANALMDWVCEMNGVNPNELKKETIINIY